VAAEAGVTTELGDTPQPSETGVEARGVAVTTAALLFGRVLTLVAGIVTVGLVSHYLGLVDFGALTTAMAYAALFAVMTDLGLSTVVTREIARDPENEHHVLGTALGIGLALALVAVALGLALMTLIYGGHENTPTRQAIVILLVQVLVAPFTGVARAFFIARQRGYLIAAGDVTLSAGMAVLTGVVAAAHLGFRAVAIAMAGGYVLQAAVMGAIAVRAGARARPARRGSWRLIGLALPLGGTLLLNYLYFRLDVLLLSWMKSDVAVGRYGLAYRVLEGLMVLPTYVMLALFPAIARSENDRPRLAATVGAALAGLEPAALGMAGLMAIFSREIVVVLGGPKYAAAAPALAILAVALAISYLSGVYGNALMALGRQRTLLWLSFGPLVANLVFNLALIPAFSVNGAAIAVVVSEIVGLFVIREYYVRIAGTPAAVRHAPILAAGVVLGALAAVKFALDLKSAPLAVVLVGGSLGSVLYAAALLWLGAVPPVILDQIPLSDRFLKALTRR
jgi:O-antigen/teichoic acid export membrane protein